MKRLLLLFVILLIVVINLSAQTLSIFDIDPSGFPTVKAKVFAFDENGEQIVDLSGYNIKIFEDGIERQGLTINCPPPKPVQAISSVLTIDISGSMCGQGLENAKSAAKAWIDALPLSKSEVAVSSFNGDNYYVQDFTKDRVALINAVEGLECGGGTDFDAGFIDKSAGSLLIAEEGNFKRIVVFLTDGNADGDEDKIIEMANGINATVYCVTLDNPTPDILKDIALKTGGQYFDNVTTKEQAENVYRNILMLAQGGDPCKIEWVSGGCQSRKKVNIEINRLNLHSDFTYSIPYDILPKIKYSSSKSIKFGKKEPGKKFKEKITITAEIETITVNSIKGGTSTINIIDFGGSTPPFTLQIGASRELTIEFSPVDSSYAYAKFEIESQACGGKYFYISGGDPRKRTLAQSVKVIFPNGDEELIAGSDTTITWQGISPDDNVKLEYTTDLGKNWETITDTASGFSYLWRVPNRPSRRVLVRATAKAKYGIIEIGDMVLIPGGTYEMGNTGGYSSDWDDEKPVHTVTISRDFLMGKYEVTQEEYEKVMGTNPSYNKGKKLPVEEVSWYDAVEYCNKLSDMEGLDRCYSGNGASIECDWDANGYRLPTEAEWEYACKAGTETDFYSGEVTSATGKDPNLDKIGWYDQNSGGETREVGQKEPNAFGLYDMSGNVWEWCWDWYSSGYYDNSPDTDPRGATGGSSRVLRGGSWGGYSLGCRSSDRGFNYPDEQSHDLGFRIARTY